jgi:hypothetical protein
MPKFFGFFGASESTETQLSCPFSVSISREDFCDIKTEVLFKRILHRVYSRSEGASDKAKIMSLFDSAEKSNAPRGLISILAKAMTKKEKIGIIYEVGVVRLASHDERQQIEKDYGSAAKSSLGVLVDFSKYSLADLVKLYQSMIYDVTVSMNTQVGLAKALQIKVSSLRGTISAAGKEEPINQAKEINEALRTGRSVLLDKNDAVETLALNSDSVKNAIGLINSQLATDLGVSLSFVNGELTTGMSATGEADANADEYGFQDFFNSIFKPTCDRLYDWNLKFVSDDWRYFQAMISNLIIVENSSLLSEEQKRAFASRLMPV